VTNFWYTYDLVQTYFCSIQSFDKLITHKWIKNICWYYSLHVKNRIQKKVLDQKQISFVFYNFLIQKRFYKRQISWINILGHFWPHGFLSIWVTWLAQLMVWLLILSCSGPNQKISWGFFLECGVHFNHLWPQMKPRLDMVDHVETTHTTYLAVIRLSECQKSLPRLDSDSLI